MKCDICGKEFKTQQGLNSHIGWHNKPERKSNFVNYNSKIKNGELSKENSNQFIKAKNLGYEIEIKEETRKKISASTTNRNIERWKDPNNIKKQSESMKKAVLNNPESYSSQNVSGRVKSFDFIDSYGNNIKLKGKWELKVANFLNEKCIKWTNKIEPQPYYWKDNWHLYFPDFYLPEKDIYLEIKGYQRDRDIEKWKYFKFKLLKIKVKEIKDLENWYIFNFNLVD